MGFVRDLHGAPIGFVLDSYGICKGFVRYLYGVPIGSVRDPMGFAWKP